MFRGEGLPYQMRRREGPLYVPPSIAQERRRKEAELKKRQEEADKRKARWEEIMGKPKPNTDPYIALRAKELTKK